MISSFHHIVYVHLRLKELPCYEQVFFNPNYFIRRAVSNLKLLMDCQISVSYNCLIASNPNGLKRDVKFQAYLATQ